MYIVQAVIRSPAGIICPKWKYLKNISHRQKRARKCSHREK